MLLSKMKIVFKFSLNKNTINLSKNYYKVLEIDMKSDQKTIKKSYLKLVKKFHPDVNKTGKEKFTEVQQAYEVLSDEELKTYYDLNFNTNKNNENFEAASTHSKPNKTSTGHQYYTHRTYKSDSPHDYYYSDPSKSYSYQSYQKQEYNQENQNEKQKRSKQQKMQEQERRKERARQAYEQYQRQKRRKQQQMYRHETMQQRKMRDKIRHMKGFASPYNSLWGQNQMRYSNMTRQQKEKQSIMRTKKMIPQKFRSYYDKVMQVLQNIAKK